METRSGEFRRKKPDGKGLVDSKRRRLAIASLSSLPEDTLVEDEKASQTSPTSTTTASLPSYFSCRICLKDTEEEPVITFCGHVFCWSFLYKSVSLGVNRLRGPCPICEFAVDLCPRTKTVCPIYYVEGPQVSHTKYLGTNEEHGEIELDSKSWDREIKSEDDSRIWRSIDGLTKIIKVDPSKRPSDKRPILRSSFVPDAIQNAATVAENFECSFHCLLGDWKSTIDEWNGIIEDMESCCKELSLRLINEQEQGVQSISSSQPASLRSSSCYICCNSCCADATFREPIITYCGHVFCMQCFYVTILGSGLLECPICRSAINASTACPISGNGKTFDSQNWEIKEKWESGVLLLNPSAVQVQIDTSINELNHEIAVRSKSICNTILKVVHSSQKFRLGLQNHLGDQYICGSRLFGEVDDFMKENANQVLARTSNINSCNTVDRPSQVVQSKLPTTTTPLSTSGPYFCCGYCHKSTPHNPVVTYCTHLFCWRCLYFHIEINGAFSEDGSLHGPCPVCNANNIIISHTNAKLTVIPICRASNSTLQEHQMIDDEEGGIQRLPPCPAAKWMSTCQLSNTRNIISETVCKFRSLMDDFRSKIDNSDKGIDFNYELVENRRHCLLLGLLDGWSWAYLGPLKIGVVGTDKADKRLSGLSRGWLDSVDVDSCVLLKESEILVP